MTNKKTDKNYINFHIITSYALSNLNRDDMGLQKTALFGGKKRVRISSQCEKRAIRKSVYYNDNIQKPSIRTRELGILLAEAQKKWGERYSKDIISDVVSLICGVNEIESETHSGAVSAWALSEVGEYCKEMKKKIEDDEIKKKIDIAGEKEREKALKAIKKDNKKNKVEELTAEQQSDLEKAFRKGSLSAWEKVFSDKLVSFSRNWEDGIDIALSGRMATSGIMSNVDAALAVAHSITTHTAQSDFDWFTAVDDLTKEGSAHLDSQEFGAGVFYKYASLNLKQLMDNLSDCSREDALEIAAHVLHMLVTVAPSAKQNACAAFNPADFAMVTFGSQPISLANAFETPVEANRNGGFIEPSIAKFQTYKKELFSKYSLDDTCAFFSMSDTEDENSKNEMKTSLDDLKNWIKQGGKRNEGGTDD